MPSDECVDACAEDQSPLLDAVDLGSPELDDFPLGEACDITDPDCEACQ